MNQGMQFIIQLNTTNVSSRRFSVLLFLIHLICNIALFNRSCIGINYLNVSQI